MSLKGFFAIFPDPDSLPEDEPMYRYEGGDCNLALKESFHITFQLYGKDRKPLDRFLEVLDGESVPYRVSDMKTRYLPWVRLPKA